LDAESVSVFVPSCTQKKGPVNVQHMPLSLLTNRFVKKAPPVAYLQKLPNTFCQRAVWFWVLLLTKVFE